MTIADLEVRLTKAAPNTANVLVIDIERLPGQATTQHRGLTISGNFWDLNGWKDTIRRRIRPDEVTRWPRTICFAYRWYGRKQIGFHAEWGKAGYAGMLEAAWNLYDKADIVVGHNVKAFDTKRLQGDWWPIGLAKPTPVKFVDTLTVCRSEFGYESNALDAVLTRIGLPGKTDRYDSTVAQAAIDGDKSAQRQLRAYNQGDIEASTLLYDSLRGWIPNHPHMGRHGTTPSCNQCSSEDLTLFESKQYRAEVLTFPLYRCNHCRALVAGRWHSGRVAVTKGVR